VVREYSRRDYSFDFRETDRDGNPCLSHACRPFEVLNSPISAGIRALLLRQIVNRLTFGRRKMCDPYFATNAKAGIQMRTGTWIGLAGVVAIGVMWSIAAMSSWVPVNSAELRSAALSSPAITVGERASAK
jgi:hypothetical protein